MKKQLTNARSRGGESENSGKVVGRNPDASKPVYGDAQYPPSTPSVGRGGNTGGSSSYRDFISPVGSVPPPSAYTDTRDRHSGLYHSNNPYFQQMRITDDKQDIDALYELAVQWEADYYNLNEQRQYAQEVLEEQRAYDDPSAVVARQRAAGINPDLVGGSAGGSAGGSSAQLAQPQMADQTGLTKFSNYYDNIGLVQSGFQTAASVLGSLTSFGSSVVGSIATFKKLPSEINLADAQASTANATADATRQLTPVQVAAGQLTNLNSALSLFDKASQIISPDTTLEGAKPVFTSVGIPDDQHEGLYNAIKAYHENPSMRNYFAQNEREARANEEYNKVYTQDVVSGMIEVGKEIQDATLAFDKDIAILKSGFTKLLDMQQLSTDIAGSIQTGAQVTAEQQKLQYKQVQRDVSAFVQNLEDLKSAEARSQKLIDDIKDRISRRQASAKLGEFLGPTPQEKAIIELEEQRIKHYRSLGSMAVSEVYSMMSQTSQTDYYASTNLSPTGNIEPTIGVQKHQLFMRYTFSDFVSGRIDSDMLTKSLVSRIPYVGDLINQAIEPL